MLVNRCDCCEEPSPCSICSDSSTQIQATVSGVSQTNSPPIETDPPCPCTGINKTYSLSYAGSGGPVGDCLSPTASGDSCQWGVESEDSCTDSGNTLSYSIDVWLYENAGDVYALVSLIISETSTSDGLTNAYNYEGYGLVASGTTLDCSTMDATITCTDVCGGPDGVLWCGTASSIEVRIEGV